MKYEIKYEIFKDTLFQRILPLKIRSRFSRYYFPGKPVLNLTLWNFKTGLGALER